MAKLICQDCGGVGSFTIPILDDGTGPQEICGFCGGTGYMTPEARNVWLLWKKNLKRKCKCGD